MVHLTQLVTAISIASVSKHRQLCSGRPCGILHYSYYAFSLFLAKVYYALVLSCIIFLPKWKGRLTSAHSAQILRNM